MDADWRDGYLYALEDVESDLCNGMQNAVVQHAEMKRRCDEMRVEVIKGRVDGEAYFEAMQELAALIGIKLALQKALDHVAVFRAGCDAFNNGQSQDTKGGSDGHRQSRD